MRMTTRVSTLAVMASVLIAAGATAQPSEKQSRKQGGPPVGGRPVVVPKGPSGAPSGFDKRARQQGGQPEKNRVPVQSFSRGPQEKSNFSSGGNRPQVRPRGGQDGPSSFSGGGLESSRSIKAQGRGANGFQAPGVIPKGQQAERSRGKIEVQPSRGNSSRNVITGKPGTEFRPSSGGFQSPAARPDAPGPKVTVQPRNAGGKVTVQPRGSNDRKATVQPRGPGGKPGIAGAPAVVPKQTDRGRSGTATVIPKGQSLPGAVTGKALPSGPSRPAVAGKGVIPGKTATVVPKGVARGITGNLPPGLAKGKLVPTASAIPGLSGKPVVLPKQVSSSAVRGFQSLRRGLDSKRPLVLPKLGGREKSVAIGANLALGGAAIGLGYSKWLSKDDALTFFGGARNPVVHTRSLTKHDIVALRSGYLPDFVPPPVPGFGYVRPPVIPAAVYTAPGYLPPAVHGHVDVAPSFSWNYWDGRCYYDHAYATNLFVSLGHTRHDGFDGAIVGGRYYAFGYGWIDGCINYGQGRVWVPGFWAPQTVTECRPVPVWVPPVYEDVWTGCCWETIQVGGGYFAPAPVEDCHTVTRYVWVPGHYEYYYV